MHLYEGGASFESRLEHCPSSLRFCIDQTFQANTGKMPRLGHDNLLPNPCYFIFILPADATVWTLKSTSDILQKQERKDLKPETHQNAILKHDFYLIENTLRLMKLEILMAVTMRNTIFWYRFLQNVDKRLLRGWDLTTITQFPKTAFTCYSL